jgi:hypothetical protein
MRRSVEIVFPDTTIWFRTALQSADDWLPWNKPADSSILDRAGKGNGMIRGILASLLGVVLLLTAACKPKPDEKEAIKAGVLKHLAAMQGLNVPNMEVNVASYSVNGNLATAQVEIRAKSGDNGGGTMNLAYNMEKRGDEWVVIKGAPAGGTLQHPAPGEMPPGHPNTGTAAGPVHPDFSEIMKGNQPAPQQTLPPSANPPPSKP